MCWVSCYSYIVPTEVIMIKMMYCHEREREREREMIPMAFCYHMWFISEDLTLCADLGSSNENINEYNA